MAKLSADLKFCGIFLMVAALSSFTIIVADESSKSEDQSSNKESSVADVSNNQIENKEKRSREEILFGNQQNKPNGLVDDLMGMSDTGGEETSFGMNDDKNFEKPQENQNSEMPLQEDDDKKTAGQEEDRNDMMMGSGSDNWYNSVPVPPGALQYLANAPALQSLSPTSFANTLYDQEDVYRRKRQLLGHPLPLRRRRSLRSSLGQMIQKRGIRMPRRSMRLKRQVDLLSLLGNEAFYDDQGQVPSENRDGWGNRMDKRHQVPGHFNSYPESAASKYRYPITVLQPNELSDANDFDDQQYKYEEPEEYNDMMLFPPFTRYSGEPDTYGPREDERDAVQKWLARYTTPNVFTVSRRSSKAFYPVDYRYFPAYKKRSVIFSNGNRMPNTYSVENNAADPDYGNWGHVVKVPEAYASAEDVARLYGLASLMAEEDDEAKVRRST